MRYTRPRSSTFSDSTLSPSFFFSAPAMAPRNYKAARGLDRTLFLRLASCDWTGSAILRRGLNPEMSPAWVPWEVAEYYQKAMQKPSATIAHVDHLVVRMRQDTPGRLTNLHDHFDPRKASLFWRQMKASFPLNDERRSAFDRQLFRFAFSAFHASLRREAKEILTAIDVDRLDRYHWYSFLSPAWFVRWGGTNLGLPLQAFAHRTKELLLGRKK